MSLSIKKMMNEQVDKWGIDVLFITSSSKVKCKCYSDNTNEGKADCKLCFGSGKVTAIQKKKAIIDSANTKFSMDTLEVIGHLDPTAVSLYIKTNNIINSQDKVLIVGWDNNKLKDVKELYVVDTVFTYRMDNGRIEGYNIIAKKTNEKISMYNNYINHLSPLNRNRLEKGEMILCPQ